MFKRDYRIKLGRQVFAIIQKALKREHVIWNPHPAVFPIDILLQSNKQTEAWMVEKRPSAPQKGMEIREMPIKKKMSVRPHPAAKGKKTTDEYEVQAEESEDEDSPVQSPLKRRRRTVAEIAQQLIFEKPMPKPSPDPRPIQSIPHFPSQSESNHLYP